MSSSRRDLQVCYVENTAESLSGDRQRFLRAHPEVDARVGGAQEGRVAKSVRTGGVRCGGLGG